MAENSPRLEGEARQNEEPFGGMPDSTVDEHYRDRLLIEATDLIVRAHGLPDLFKELAPRILNLTGCEFLKFALHDPRQNCMVTHYWKRSRESGATRRLSCGRVCDRLGLEAAGDDHDFRC